MKTLKIEIPEGFEIKDFNKETGEIKFSPVKKEITDRIKTFEDVLLELSIDPVTFKSNLYALTPDEVAYRQVKLIAEALNEGWKPNWADSSEYKYTPWFDMESSSGSGFASHDYAYWNASSDVGSRLCFKTRELAKYAGTQFKEIYKEFFLIK